MTTTTSRRSALWERPLRMRSIRLRPRGPAGYDDDDLEDDED